MELWFTVAMNATSAAIALCCSGPAVEKGWKTSLSSITAGRRPLADVHVIIWSLKHLPDYVSLTKWLELFCTFRHEQSNHTCWLIHLSHLQVSNFSARLMKMKRYRHPKRFFILFYQEVLRLTYYVSSVVQLGARVGSQQPQTLKARCARAEQVTVSCSNLEVSVPFKNTARTSAFIETEVLWWDERDGGFIFTCWKWN